MLRVPFTNVWVNQFGLVKYPGEYRIRVDRGFSNKAHYQQIKTKNKRFYYVHRLVARVFVENPCPEYFDQVHHLDNNRQNNNHTNLQWTSKKLNNAWKTNQKLVKKTHDGFQVVFIFDKKTFTLPKIYRDEKKAEIDAKIYKLSLINAERQHTVECAKSGFDPVRKHNEHITRVVNNYNGI